MKLFCTIVVVAFILFLIFPPTRIIGTSMYPTYKHGEIILARRIFNRRKLKVGDVYVFRRYNDSINEFIYVIKRLEKIAYDVDCRNQPITLCYFLGDNPSASIDSRDYGFVNSEEIIAKIVKPRALK